MTGGLGHKRKLEGQGEGTTADDNDFSPSPSTPSLSPPPPPPTTSHSSPTSTPLGSRLLLKAGYRGAGGLGRLEQGSSAPLSPSQQLSTHGLGFRSTTTKRRRHSYTPAPHVQVAISPEWLPTTPSLSPPPSPPLSYLTIAPHDDSLTTSPLYCPLTLQHALHTAKSAFDCIDPRTFRAARTRANPFELLRAEMFQNRAALKMAEVDRITERLFTSMPAARPLLRFGDVCAGPGGFSEYVLTRVKWRGKGWGLTLRGAQDFRVDKFNPNAPPHSFKACYGADGTGDVTRSDNIRHFAREVQSECEGLDVCMADGGFDVAGEEDKQELRSQQLILCECIIALAALRVGGSFVCKLFDVFLPFSVGLLYLMHRCFDALAIIKPNQSRPANSERYLVCRGKREGIDGVLRYLYHANDRINELKRTPSTFPNKSDRRRPRSPPPPLSFPPAEPEMAVLSLVPEDVITADAAFLSYIQRSNESIAERQVDALQRLLRYVEDPNLPSDDQEGIRLQCLRWWEVTDQREQEARREQRRRRVERDGLEDVAAVEQVEGEDDEVDEVGYIHFDPSWGSLHFSRHPHQGFFSQQAADRLHADLIEQLRSVIPLEPLPTVEEREAYRKRTHTAPSVRQLHSFCDHSWSCLLVPSGGVHSFILSSPAGLFLLDDRDLLMPLPSSYHFNLPSDTIVECLLYPARIVFIDAWSLPSPPSLFPTDRTLWLHRSPLTHRLSQLRLLMEALRLSSGEGGVEVAEVREWGDVRSVWEGEDDVLFVREEAKRPSVTRWWDGMDARRLSAAAMQEVVEGVTKERVREAERALAKTKREQQQSSAEQ